MVAAVLSGTLSDGTAGLAAVRKRGGVAIVQDPDDALYTGMPSNALQEVGADHVVEAAEVGALIAKLAREDVDDGLEPPEPPEPPDVGEVIDQEVAFMDGDLDALDGDHPGRPSPWPCPDCSGVLWEIDDGPALRFRCRVGHAWGAESLLEAQSSEVEAALWMALRSMEDRAALSRSLAERSERNGNVLTARRFQDDADDLEQPIVALRRLVNAEPVPALRDDPVDG